MVFSSSLFLVYFLPLFLLCYFLCPVRFRNWLILVASIFFYSWGAPRFIFVILGTTLLDFLLVRSMYVSQSRSRRKLFLWLSLSVNLGLLFYFKYCGFFVENLAALLQTFGMGWSPALEIVLPIGISFYTFETITYVVDVYRGIHPPQKSFREYLLYIILFPKLIAGPIIRYHEIAPQLTDRPLDGDGSTRLSGFHRFFIGLAKKVLIANTMGAALVHIDWRGEVELTTVYAWMGALFYTMQIYFDFSGYSDMAIGLGRMMGFQFPENFNNPYTAAGITDFWRRWHMTLGSWMRQYLYIPLGGNRGSLAQTFVNLWIVFFLSGFWHGANWNFLLWGAFHGTFLVLERLFLQRVYDKLPRIAVVLFTFILVAVGWTLFRFEDPAKWQLHLQAMFRFDGWGEGIHFAKEEVMVLITALIFSFFTLIPGGKRLQEVFFEGRTSYLWKAGITFLVVLLFVWSLSAVTASDFNPFIYFRF